MLLTPTQAAFRWPLTLPLPLTVANRSWPAVLPGSRKRLAALASGRCGCILARMRHPRVILSLGALLAGLLAGGTARADDAAVH